MTVGYNARIFPIVIPTANCFMKSTLQIPTQFLPSSGNYLYFASAMYDTTSGIFGINARCYIDSGNNDRLIYITSTTPSTSSTSNVFFQVNINLFPFTMNWCL